MFLFTWMRYKRLQYLHEWDTKDYHISKKNDSASTELNSCPNLELFNP